MRCSICGAPTGAGQHGKCVERLMQANGTYSAQYAAHAERERGMFKSARRILTGLRSASAVLYAGERAVKRVTS